MNKCYQILSRTREVSRLLLKLLIEPEHEENTSGIFERANRGRSRGQGPDAGREAAREWRVQAWAGPRPDHQLPRRLLLQGPAAGRHSAPRLSRQSFQHFSTQNHLATFLKNLGGPARGPGERRAPRLPARAPERVGLHLRSPGAPASALGRRGLPASQRQASGRLRRLTFSDSTGFLSGQASFLGGTLEF